MNKNYNLLIHEFTTDHEFSVGYFSDVIGSGINMKRSVLGFVSSVRYIGSRLKVPESSK